MSLPSPLIFRCSRLLALLIAGAASAPAALAGPLDPPPGPVAPTLKTLDQVRPGTPIEGVPSVISVPGAYYLTANLDHAGPEPAISVEAPDVTLDLSGFGLTGPGPKSGVDAVKTGKAATNLRVINGSVRGFNVGVYADTRNTQVIGVRAANCAYGIYAAATLISECSAVENTIAGITTIPEAYQIPGIGPVLASGAAVVQRCSASGNAQAGFDICEGTLLIDSAASVNVRVGINTNGPCRIQRCSVVGTLADAGAGLPGYGVVLSTGSNITDTTVRGCASGGVFLLASRNVVKGCNVSANGAFGIGGPGFPASVSNGYFSEISDNHVTGHTEVPGVGIAVTSECSITNNVVFNNLEAGITVSGGGNRIIGNQVRGNGYNGGAFNFTGNIVIFGDRNHIEANACNNGVRTGIYLLSQRNVVIRNVCGGNPNANYIIGSGNIAGPIIDRVASGGNITTSDPSANISY